MRRFIVKSRLDSYRVIVGQGAWRELRRFPHARYTSVFILTERPVWRLWKESFLAASGVEGAKEIFVPSGERSKSLQMFERVAGTLLNRRADRGSLLIAFGGGVVGDLGGFVASTYMRGIDYVQVPTTVVAQMDSSIGGKTAVNVGTMKNLIGTISPPRMVLADPVVLQSLPERTFRTGFYEVVKHGILSGPALFTLLEKQMPNLKPDSTALLERVLAPAVKVKVDVVNHDEHEGGLRRVLNLGHTFGHALEGATGYRRLLHGEAVGWGLLCAARLGVMLEMLGPRQAERIAGLVRCVSPLPSIRDLDAAKIIRFFSRDKKTVGGHTHWVVPERIGKVSIVRDVPVAVAAAALRSVQQAED